MRWDTPFLRYIDEKQTTLSYHSKANLPPSHLPPQPTAALNISGWAHLLTANRDIFPGIPTTLIRSPNPAFCMFSSSGSNCLSRVDLISLRWWRRTRTAFPPADSPMMWMFYIPTVTTPLKGEENCDIPTFDSNPNTLVMYNQPVTESSNDPGKAFSLLVDFL